MNKERIRILLIEDDAQDAALLEMSLSRVRNDSFEVETVRLLEEGLKLLAQTPPDAILLDLNLPDSAGGKPTFERVHAQAGETPIVVLTGQEDEALALELVQAGAQDYLIKGQLDSPLLGRAIRYSIERQQLLGALEAASQKREQEKEMHSLEALSRQAPSAVSSAMLGVVSLHKSSPEYFTQWVQRFGKLMALALEQRGFKVAHPIEEGMRALGEELGDFKATARDVIELYNASLKQTKEGCGGNAAKLQAYAEEGRIRVLELMGYLLAFYRNKSLGRGVES